jgi:hypothetical protein
MYQPRPIDTTEVALSPDLLALTERLAENAHDIWAARRIAGNWRRRHIWRRKNRGLFSVHCATPPEGGSCMVRLAAQTWYGRGACEAVSSGA